MCYITASLCILQNLLTTLLLKTGRTMFSSCCYRLSEATAQYRKEKSPGSQHTIKSLSSIRFLPRIYTSVPSDALFYPPRYFLQKMPFLKLI